MKAVAKSWILVLFCAAVIPGILGCSMFGGSDDDPVTTDPSYSVDLDGTNDQGRLNQ